MTDWGAGNFLALKFSNIPASATSVKVGLEPSQGSGLVELDNDKNAVCKITNKFVQKFVVQTSDGQIVHKEYYDLSGLTITEAP